MIKEGVDIRRNGLPALEICLVTQQLRNVFSGPGIYARNVLQHLVKDGHRVTVVSLGDEKLPELGGYKFHEVQHRLLLSNHARWVELSISFNKALQALENHTYFDLIHFADARDAFFCKTKAPRVGNINDTYPADLQPIAQYFQNYHDWLARWGYYWAVHQLERIYLTGLDAIISNSNFTTQVISHAYPNTAKKVFTIYKSVDSQQFTKALEIRKSANFCQKPVILMVGSNLQRKGIRTIIQAALEVLPKIPDCLFKIAGDDPAVPEFRIMCEQLNIADHIIFLGHQSRDQLLELYSEAAVFILPAITESFGVVILEAMASGVPVIGSNVGGIPEIIRDGINGLMIPPNSPTELAQAIYLLLQNRDMQVQFAKSGIETAQQFSIEKMMIETYQVYSHLLNKDIMLRKDQET